MVNNFGGIVQRLHAYFGHKLVCRKLLLKIVHLIPRQTWSLIKDKEVHQIFYGKKTDETYRIQLKCKWKDRDETKMYMNVLYRKIPFLLLYKSFEKWVHLQVLCNVKLIFQKP